MAHFERRQAEKLIEDQFTAYGFKPVTTEALRDKIDSALSSLSLGTNPMRYSASITKASVYMDPLKSDKGNVMTREGRIELFLQSDVTKKLAPADVKDKLADLIAELKTDEHQSTTSVIAALETRIGEALAALAHDRGVDLQQHYGEGNTYHLPGEITEALYEHLNAKLERAAPKGIMLSDVRDAKVEAIVTESAAAEVAAKPARSAPRHSASTPAGRVRKHSAPVAVDTDERSLLRVIRNEEKPALERLSAGLKLLESYGFSRGDMGQIMNVGKGVFDGAISRLHKAAQKSRVSGEEENVAVNEHLITLFSQDYTPRIVEHLRGKGVTVTTEMEKLITQQIPQWIEIVSKKKTRPAAGSKRITTAAIGGEVEAEEEGIAAASESTTPDMEQPGTAPKALDIGEGDDGVVAPAQHRDLEPHNLFDVMVKNSTITAAMAALDEMNKGDTTKSGIARYEKPAKAVTMAARELIMKDKPGYAEKAVALIEHAFDVLQSRQDNFLLSQAAFACEKLGKVDDAIAYYSEGLKVDPHDKVLWKGLAKLLERKGDLTAASQAFEKMIEAAHRSGVELSAEEIAYAQGLIDHVKALKAASAPVVATDVAASSQHPLHNGVADRTYVDRGVASEHARAQGANERA